MSRDDELSPELEELGLTTHVAELADSGLTVVPPQVTGVSASSVRSLTDLVLRRAREFVGCGFSRWKAARMQTSSTTPTRSRWT